MDMSVLNNRFEILKTLNKDDKARTYLASDIQTGKRVVLKELNLGQALDWKSVELFERESKVLRHLNHPAIPDYIDAFHIDEGTRAFIAQEYIHGENLESLRSKSTRYNEDQIRELLDQMLDVLTYLHAFSPPVIHRKIQPSNILRDTQGNFYLIDFGAVQTIAQDNLGGSTIVGTSGYMPPEQLMGKAVPASDLYALAATCIHLASGIQPVNLPVARMKLQFRDLVSLSDPLCDILEKMLEPDISERFTRAEQVQKALQSGNIESSEIAKNHTQSLTTSKSSTTLAGLNDLHALIANPPVSKPVSDVQIQNDTLTIHINTPFQIPWRAITYIALAAVAMLAFAIKYAEGGLYFIAFAILAGGIFGKIATARLTNGSGSDKLIISPENIQIISRNENNLQLPMAKLRKCYLEADAEEIAAKIKTDTTSNTSASPPPSGIYFNDDQGDEYYFRTTGITTFLKSSGTNPDALLEIRWIYDTIQSYLKAATTPSAPRTPDVLATEKLETTTIDQQTVVLNNQA